MTNYRDRIHLQHPSWERFARSRGQTFPVEGWVSFSPAGGSVSRRRNQLKKNVCASDGKAVACEKGGSSVVYGLNSQAFLLAQGAKSQAENKLRSCRLAAYAAVDTEKAVVSRRRIGEREKTWTPNMVYAVGETRISEAEAFKRLAKGREEALALFKKCEGTDFPQGQEGRFFEFRYDNYLNGL